MKGLKTAIDLSRKRMILLQLEHLENIYNGEIDEFLFKKKRLLLMLFRIESRKF